MKTFNALLSNHVDLAIAALIIVAGMVYSLVLGYNAPYLAGTYAGAVFLGAGLAVALTFPFFLYLIGKYARLGLRTLSHRI